MIQHLQTHLHTRVCCCTFHNSCSVESTHQQLKKECGVCTLRSLTQQQRMKWCHLQENDGTGDHVKWNRQGSEWEISHHTAPSYVEFRLRYGVWGRVWCGRVGSVCVEGGLGRGSGPAVEQERTVGRWAWQGILHTYLHETRHDGHAFGPLTGEAESARESWVQGWPALL